MDSPFYFVIKPLNGRRYDNLRQFGDKEFIISSSQEDHTVTNRVAVVMSVPIGYNGPIKEGAEVIVHHNVFRIYYDMKGRERSSWNHYKDDIFMVDMYQLFLYKNIGEDWTAPYPYCFVRPLANDFSDPILSVGHEKALWGEMVHSSIDSVYKGDTVSFIPDSEYEFKIDGEKMYRVKSTSICLKT